MFVCTKLDLTRFSHSSVPMVGRARENLLIEMSLSSKGHSRSSAMPPFDTAHTCSCSVLGLFLAAFPGCCELLFENQKEGQHPLTGQRAANFNFNFSICAFHACICFMIYNGSKFAVFRLYQNRTITQTQQIKLHILNQVQVI